MPPPFTQERDFHAYVRVLVAHHLHQTADREEDSHFAALEHRLSTLWERLDEEHRAEARGVSSDLNWIRRGYAPPPRGRKTEDVPSEELQEFYRLMESQDPRPLLRRLRAVAAAVPAALVASCRANWYAKLGLPEVSALFLRAAIELGASESTLTRAAFDVLIQVNPGLAFDTASRVIAAPEKFAPVAVAQAIAFVIDFLGGDLSAFRLDDLADKLRQAGRRIEAEATPPPDRVRFYSMAGPHLVAFGAMDEGVAFLERAREIEPGNAELIGWMGEAVYAGDRERAVELFEQAVALGTRLVRPYLRLADYYLVKGDFHQANEYAAGAAERARDDFSLAVALEVMAISFYELGAPQAVVRDLLRRSAHLAPGVPTITRNLESFERYLSQKLSRAMWATDEQGPLFGAQERWRTREVSPTVIPAGS